MILPPKTWNRKLTSKCYFLDPHYKWSRVFLTLTLCRHLFCRPACLCHSASCLGIKTSTLTGIQTYTWRASQLYLPPSILSKDSFVSDSWKFPFLVCMCIKEKLLSSEHSAHLLNDPRPTGNSGNQLWTSLKPDFPLLQKRKERIYILPHGPTRDLNSESCLLGVCPSFCHIQVLSISAWRDLLKSHLREAM